MKGLNKIKCKYLIQVIFDYTPLNIYIEIIKYNKQLSKELNYSEKDIKNFLFLKKIIKPIANCEDYLPIIKRVINPNNNILNQLNENDLFCKYINKSDEFIPQINKINGNEHLLNSLNKIKLGFNYQLIYYFYNKKTGNFDIQKLTEFCEKYGNKIKEITFLDNDISFTNENIAYFIMKYIIEHSDVQRIEDSLFTKTNNSIFLYLLDLDYKYEVKKKPKTKNDIIKQLKFYSFYLFHKNGNNSEIINSFCENILYNGKNIEELEIRNIDKDNSSNLVNLISNLVNLKSLKILNAENESIFDKISEKIKENCLEKLFIKVNYFEKAFNILDKNKKSLEKLYIIIKSKNEENDINIIKTLSDIINLKILIIDANFSIINENNIKYLSFKKVETLFIPLIISKYLFNFNSFFKNIPHLKIICFNNIIFNEKKEERQYNINLMDKFNLDDNLVKNIKKIYFFKASKNSSFFILKFLKFFSNNKSKFNIREIEINKCDFIQDIEYNSLLEIISKFINITSLSLKYLSFEKEQKININIIKNLNKLEYLYLKDFNYKINNINIDEFLSLLSLNHKYLNEIGLSCKEIDGEMLNLIAPKIKEFKYLTKLNFFNGYNDINPNEITKKKKLRFIFILNNSIQDIINICNINRYCMIDLRNIDIKIDINKICRNIPKLDNHLNDYFCYQRIFNHKFCPNDSNLIYSSQLKTYYIECRKIYYNYDDDDYYYDNDNDYVGEDNENDYNNYDDYDYDYNPYSPSNFYGD